eukprot:scaffold314335_cov35-Tisochrysis_lutea.AAC.3
MSAKIVLKGAENGTPPQFMDLLPQAPQISAFDAACGTWDSASYAPGADKYQHCRSKHFLCGANQQSDFNVCLAAIGNSYTRPRLFVITRDGSVSFHACVMTFGQA